ncbi:extracellular solute-binding protein [Cohnella massiliensis]|uniref:extracellular solute-binding protein n=1 Tax=Cohnella massiliensis TaxID=1816691 RepID=UPI0009BC0DAE|nr:extracellular solute-binding protein [Cohnella massiliensis]
MTAKRWWMGVSAAVLAAGVLAGCARSETGGAGEAEDGGPLAVSMALTQVGEIPAKDNAVEKLLEEYTETELDIQWIPQSAYDEKVSVMMASKEMPKIIKLNYVPLVINAIRSGDFWEIGPYLPEYPNLSAQDEQHYKNISVEGKIYGVPLFRDMGRATFNYRKDWLDKLGLDIPTNPDEWYEAQKAFVTGDPDGNGKDDTYGWMLDKQYNTGISALLTRLAVANGSVNKWGIVDGKMTPDFTQPEFFEVLSMFRCMYEEKLINQDFAVLDGSEVGLKFDAGTAGFGNSVAGALKSQHERLTKADPDAVVDNSGFIGPEGIRLAGEPGHNGFLAIPKSSVKTEDELKRILAFLDDMMNEDAANLLVRGIKDVHYADTDDGKTEITDFDAFQLEVKPYRDNLLYVEGYNTKPLKDTPQGEKGTRMAKENLQYAVPNEALTLTSAMYSERGNELETMIGDAMTKYIMGEIDEAGWQKEIENWRKAGGDEVIREFQESYDSIHK